MLTNERAEQIAKYLTDDTVRGRVLLDLSAEEAMARINADGNDFTLEEIREFGKQLQLIADANNREGELSAEELDDIAGGAFITLTAAGMATVFATCCAAGWAMAERHGW